MEKLKSKKTLVLWSTLIIGIAFILACETSVKVSEDEPFYDETVDTAEVSVNPSTKLFVAENPSDASSFTKLVWSDEFNGDSLDTSCWKYETGAGGWGNNEIQTYKKGTSNCEVTNGVLKISARENKTSARIITKDKKHFKYGKVEARIKMDQGQGSWPAFWMLGANIDDVSWPACGEIDIMEHINKEKEVLQTLHWDFNGHAMWGTGMEEYRNYNLPYPKDIDVSEWHTYGITWTEDKITMELDGKTYFSSGIGNYNGLDAFNKPFFFILNYAMGGNLPGTNTCKNLPWHMYVDYLRVYQ